MIRGTTDSHYFTIELAKKKFCQKILEQLVTFFDVALKFGGKTCRQNFFKTKIKICVRHNKLNRVKNLTFGTMHYLPA